MSDVSHQPFRAPPPKIVIDLVGDDCFLLFDPDSVDTLLREYRMVVQPFLPIPNRDIPAQLLPEQVQVLLEHGFAKVRQLKPDFLGTVPPYFEGCSTSTQTCEKEKDAEKYEAHLLKLAEKIAWGRKTVGRKRKLLQTEGKMLNNESKRQKLDEETAIETLETCEATEIFGSEENEASSSNKCENDTTESELDQQIPQKEIQAIVEELRQRDVEKQTTTFVNFCFSDESAYELVSNPPFPTSLKYLCLLTTFRDLWRKGFYLTTGTKFGCDYLAYEMPPGEVHSRFMVIVQDSHSAMLTPLDMIAVSRVASQVKKHVLLSIVTAGTLIPYYLEINWWKGDDCQQRGELHTSQKKEEDQT